MGFVWFVFCRFKTKKMKHLKKTFRIYLKMVLFGILNYTECIEVFFEINDYFLHTCINIYI